MEWLRTHLYTAALCGAGALILLGVFVVIEKSSAPAGGAGPLAWGGAGAILNPSSPDSPQTQQTPGIMQQVQNGAPYNYILPAPQTGSAESGGAGDGFDFDAFISMLSQGSGNAAVSGSSSVTGAYAFIPSGLISTSNETPKRTKLQQSLYEYGNEAGSFIQSFEQQHPNETRVLTDQAQDRADAVKSAALVSLGNGLSALGDSLLTIDNVPSSVSAAHLALAQSYKDIGTRLSAIAETKSDADFVAGVQSYNASADIFVRNYTALANLFGAYGVVFAQTDPGSLFTFTNASL